MKRKKLILSIALIFLVLIILSFLYFYYFHYSFLLIEKSKYLTNTSELYSRFTPYLQDVVNFRLKAIGCSPSKYYYENKSICFVCGEVNACFKYAIVNRGDEGIKMNYQGSYLIGNYDNLTALSFYSFGVNKILNCDENFFCDNGIRGELNNELGFTRALFTFPNEFSIFKINEIVLKIANSFGFDTTNCQKSFSEEILFCAENKFSVVWYGNNVLEFHIQ